jgi:pimeloyl-ACP methyl ester carboxylesterase
VDLEPRELEDLERFGWCDDEPECDEDSRGLLLDVDYIKYYSTKSLGKYWDSWLTGLSALGYIDDVVEPDIRNSVTTYEVTYCTVDFDGTPVVGSGMLALPSTWYLFSLPTVVYNHGTSVYRYDTPSNPDVDEVFDGPTPMVIFAGGGYAYIAPDLTGFGESTAPYHRYFHAETAASETLDMLTAVESYWLYWLYADGRLFNAGFSQGTQSAVAFAEEAEASGYEFEATGLIGSVLDPDPWFEYLSEVEESGYLQLYAADLLVSYDRIYGDVYDDPSEAFSDDFDDIIEDLFDMDHTYVEVVDSMPGSLAELLTPEFYAEVTDPDSAFRTYLRENAVDDVCLDHPIRMYHMIDDDEVPFETAEASAEMLESCNEVEFVPWEDTDHLNTWHQTLPEVRDYFDSF